ncbi:hypothetical protein RGQ29_025858 [Quercus rubra]|uniref:Uncharacterized protein n=1 Tax=Quercus rubra TaxID=3512 RepID=A0AAN7IMI7_QUERU|nr:hypothetical protein RGQ29_025858 [Quercus rubra]
MTSVELRWKMLCTQNHQDSDYTSGDQHSLLTTQHSIVPCTA